MELITYWKPSARDQGFRRWSYPWWLVGHQHPCKEKAKSQKCIEEFVEAGEPKGIKQMKAENSKLNGDLVIELDLAKYIIEKML